MIPRTLHNMGSMQCVSAMQKCIRRGMEKEAMEFACELIHTSKPFTTMVCNRLEIISHEDIDVIDAPWIVPFVHTACEQAKAWHDKEKIGKTRMAIGNAIRIMCKAVKSREGDHFHIAIGLRNLIEEVTPEIPDFAIDMHTIEGKRLGRDLNHFRAESTKLDNESESSKNDQYEDEAFRLLAIKHSMKLKAKRPQAKPKQKTLEV